MKTQILKSTLPSFLPQRSFRCAACVLVLTTVLASPPAHAANYYVGPGCTYTTIEDAVLMAIFSAADDEIRVVNSVEYTVTDSIDIVASDPVAAGELVIRGGFATCASTTPTDITIIRRTNATGPVFQVTSAGAAPTHVRFDDLSIRGGSIGIKVTDSGADVTLDTVTVQETGIGIEVTNGGAADLGFGTIISENLAVRGGGVYCEGGTVTSQAFIHDNEATISGGGIFAGSGCTFILEAGSVLSGNEAGFGGGMSVQSGGNLTSSGTVTINGNTATNNGGGVHVVDAGVFLTDGRIHDNSATRGGGIAARTNATMTMNASVGCLASEPECSLLRGNSSDGEGHAVFADSGAEVNLFRTHVISHRQNGGWAGEAVFTEDTNTAVLLESVRYWDNHTNSLFFADLGSFVTAAFVSAAGNQWANEPPPGLQPIFFSSAGANAAGGAGVDFYSSALSGHGGFLTSMPSVVRGECVVAETLAGLTPITIPQYQIAGDPLFADPAAGVLRLQPGSVAVDFCDEFGYSPQSTDLRGVARNVDLPEPDFIGTYDLGAYELQADDLPIFEDGFESGDTTAWDS